MEWTVVPFVWNPRALLLNVACTRVFPPWAAGARGPCRAGPRWGAAWVRARALRARLRWSAEHSGVGRAVRKRAAQEGIRFSYFSELLKVYSI